MTSATYLDARSSNLLVKGRLELVHIQAPDKVSIARHLFLFV
ncbi:hypothetical protein [Vibrio vulnificus]|nr:hypothetical protein [Vibrio vulnificus]